ncbi:thrombospondin type 3 repeat-containing protein [Haloferula sp. BvORR071]|uniref:thrombospondin type 3 repeat-containing protein n=1 Tax=Haloferula sp. BvORR071 TaxID=1396141 RepID=UPI00054D3F3F|nr:thrombospondin type 3 repeat-containing protein [Haloferula sp. BvORR071]
MKLPPIFLIAGLALLPGILSAELISYDGFDYPAGDLVGSGGSGWVAPWDGTNPVIVRTPGLTYKDATGNLLTVTGSALNTADGSGTTTISGREVTDRNAETWVSMLLQPQTASSAFLGISFYQNDLTQANARFAIENNGNKDLRLTRRVTPQVNSGVFGSTLGTTVFAVLHLVPGGGNDVATPDRIDVFFNPGLAVEPATANGSININGLQYDRVRVAGANGNSILVDEIRIGTTYADVTPFTPPVDPDTDNDGITDSREIRLGLDPLVPDTAFIAAVKANPGLFNLHSRVEIVDRKIRGPILSVFSAGSVDYGFEIRKRNGDVIDSVSNPLLSPVPAPKKFLRLYLNTP